MDDWRERPEGTAGAAGRVILVREWETQMSSSGCCGRLEGDFLAPGGKPCFPERRAVMESMGPLYRELRARFSDQVELHVVDPRNLVTLVGLLWQDVRDSHVSVWQALGTLFRISVTGVVVNGRLISRGAWPDADVVSEALGEPPPPRWEVVGDLA